MSVFNAPLYYVRGNHDYDYDRNRRKAVRI